MRARSLSETSESARRVGSYRGGPLRFRLGRALVRADARRSHPASRLGQRSVPQLCGHALAGSARYLGVEARALSDIAEMRDGFDRDHRRPPYESISNGMTARWSRYAVI